MWAKRLWLAVLPWLILAGAAAAASGSEPSPVPAVAASASGTAKPNFLLITIDTLRADHLPAYGYRKLKTPAVDSLVQDGVLFKRAVAHAPITLPSHTSILTGLYPLTHGVRNNGDYYLPDDVVTLAQMLKPNGYRTAAFVSAFLLDARYGLNKGFDVYDDSTTTPSSQLRPDLIKRRPAGETLARVLAWLDANYAAPAKPDQPFFLWAHFYDPHKDYDPPEPFRTRYQDDFYDAEIAYTDQEVGILFEHLKKLGLYRDTLVVLTGDHGESLGEHGESAHSIFIYDSTQRIPLVVKLPQERQAGTSVARLARHVDIVPTVLDVLSLPQAAPPGLPGRSLLPLILGRASDPAAVAVSYAEAYLPKDYYGWSSLESIEDGHHKFIQAPTPELYDLDLDPREKDNLAPQEGDRAAQMRADLEALESRYASHAAPSRAAHEPDAALLAALRASGYMGGLPTSPSESGRDPKDMIGIQETMLEAHRHIAQEDYTEGMRILRQLLRTNPENVSARATLADTLRKMGQIDESIAEYGTILKLAPDSFTARLSLANIHIKDKVDFPAALREISEAQALAPKEPSALVLRGDLAQARGNLDEAMRFYRQAEEMGERSSNLGVGLGSAWNKKGQFALALEKLQSAVEAEPDNPEAHYNLGVVFEHSGVPDKAEKEYRLAIRYNPRNYLSYGNLGGLYQKQGRRKEAREALLAALKIKPDDLVALFNLGSVYLDTGRPREALALFKKVVALNPALALGRSSLAQSYLKLGMKDQAFRQYEQVARQDHAVDAARGQAWYAMAKIRASQKRRQEAQECLGEALRLGGDGLKRQAAGEPLFAGWRLPPSP